MSFVEAMEVRQLLSTGTVIAPAVAPVVYYISASGKDTNAGTSPATAWRSLAEANQHTFNAGDSILLQGGAVFSGNLYFASNDAGTAAHPIVVSSYGSGRATISAGVGDGITIHDTAGINISNLIIQGTGLSVFTGTGIDLMNDLPGVVHLTDINITNVDVSGFGLFGIGIGSTTLTGGFSNVSITNSDVYNNCQSGIFSYAGAYTTNPAPYGFAHSNIYIADVDAYDNPGRSGNTDAGNGIILGNVNGATITRCNAYGNGAANNSTSGGPAGIWTANSNDVTIEYCQSYDNVTKYRDGDGFDMDGGTTNCLEQYNYSHDNDGAGFLICNFAQGMPNSGNVMRFNISQNDGRKNNYPAIDLWAASSSDTINNAQIYNNTIYITPPPTGTTAAIMFKQATNNVDVWNNIFFTKGNVPTVVVPYVGTKLQFLDNDYWAGSANSVQISYAGKAYQTLAAWRAATGQETLKGKALGYAVAPLMQNPGTGVAVPTAELLNTVSAYRIFSYSPLINAGLDLDSLDVNPGNTDYYGDQLPYNKPLTIGADE